MGSGPQQTTSTDQTQNQIQNLIQNATQSQQQSGTQTQQTGPWAPTAGALTNLVAGISGQPTGVTPEQSAAISQLGGALSGLPNSAAPSEAAISQIFGTNTQPQQGMLGSAYNSYLRSLSPILDPTNLNPMNTPGFSQALGATGQNITNQVNMAAAGAGRTASSPEYAAALSRGLAAGEAPTIAQQYNANVGSLLQGAGGAFGAGSTTAQGQGTLMSQDVQNQLLAMSAAGQLPSIVSAAPSAYLSAANQAYNQPYQNISTPLGMLSPLAQAFGTTTGGYTGTGTGTSAGTQYGTTQGTTQGTSTTTQSNPLMNQLIGGGLLGLGVASKLGMFSDVRVKEGVEPVGLLFNGLPIYKYNYKFDPAKTPQIGLLAQDVEQVMPEAVGNVGGIKTVRYDVATRGAV